MSCDDTESPGDKLFQNGDIYVGDFDGLIPHGSGKYIWLDGTSYEGEWEKGKITRRGRICWPSGTTYEGDFCGGFLHGSGTSLGSNGSTYKGSWRMNIQHGLGTKTYSNSDIYEGFWKEGLQEGVGKYIWSNGSTYIGNWKAGKMSGRGVMKWANGDMFNGLWLDGLEHGLGYYKCADGAYYFGTWSKGQKDGRGIFYPAGSKLPSEQKFYESVGCNDETLCLALSLNTNEVAKKNSGLRSRSLKVWNVSSIIRHSHRISHRAAPFDGIWDINNSLGSVSPQGSSLTLSGSSDEGQNVLQDDSVLVYEREYMQGVLVMERARTYDSGVLHKKKWQHMIRKQKRRPGETIYKGHKSYYLMLNLQLGIRYTVGKITPVPMREVRSSDFGPHARIRMYFPRKGSQFTPPHYSIDFSWKDYCPMVFRNLREMFKIDAADYMMSICGGDGLKEVSSPGKSGSIFYISQDDRFVIKTLRKYELKKFKAKTAHIKILLKMLPEYYSHVRSYDNTLITKFFGLHRITIRSGRKVRFVVMGNMFCTELRIHERYDLKGSSQGRSTNKQKITENTTLKDLDLSYVFHLEKSWRESLFRQLSLDCMFLESQCIMDYSLLLGLHFRAPEHLKAPLESQDALQTSAIVSGNPSDVPLANEAVIPLKGLFLVTHKPNSASNIPGSHIRGSTLRASAVGDEEVDLLLPGTRRLRVQLGVNMPAQAHRRLLHKEGPDSAEIDLFEVYDVVLYLGIIDILQEYNMPKTIEHACKSLMFDPMSISAVEPKLYAQRFISFLEKVFPEQI